MNPEIQIRRASNGEWYYLVVGGNGEVLVSSETYTRPSDAERGARDLIAAVFAFTAQSTSFVFSEVHDA